MNLSYQQLVAKTRPLNWSWVEPGLFPSWTFEEVDANGWRDFIEEYWYTSIYASLIYILVLFGIKFYMKERPAFDLKTPLILWDIALGIFSIIGFYRTAPTLFYILQKPDGPFHSLCSMEDMSSPMLYWVILFGISKFVELGDTIFIALKKKPMVLLQWYHHVGTLIMTWVMMPKAEPISRYFIVMNYGVHAVMYPYFALKTMGYRVPRLCGQMVTTLQLTQMVIGLVVNMVTGYLWYRGDHCYRHTHSLGGFIVLYSSFVCLFGKLWLDNVINVIWKKKLKPENKSSSSSKKSK